MGSSIDLNAIATRLSDADAAPSKEVVTDLLRQQRISFPGAQPVSFAKRHLKELEEMDYYMCEKTDGIRCLLFLHMLPGEDGSPQEAQYLIDRKNDYYYVPRDALHIPLAEELSRFHMGTILDGELVVEHIPEQGGDVLYYIFFDCLCLDGQSICSYPYDIRLGKLHKFVYEPWKRFADTYRDDARAQPFQLRLKKMEVPYGTEMMFKEVIPKLRHGNDGLIFTCKSTPYIAGTDQHILKWKPPHENTVDFRLQIMSFPIATDEEGEYEDYDAIPEIELLVNMGSHEAHYSMLALTTQEWDGFKMLHQQLDHRIIECWRDARTGHWRPKMEKDGTPRFRDDKREANYIKTVESVMESIEDAVSEADLISCAARIKQSWKRRQKSVEDERSRRKAEDAARARHAEAQVHNDTPGYE